MRSRCEPILQRFNFHWPTSLDCDGLPSHSTRDDLCIEPPGEHDSFPGDDSQLDAAPDLLHHHAGTHGNDNDNDNLVTVGWTTLLYSAELWPLTVTLSKRLDAAHHRWLRSILGVSWKDKVTNEEVRARTGQQSILNTLSGKTALAR